jgi:hypothetical protein
MPVGLFEGSVGGGVHILLAQVWLSFIGLPFGLLAFMAYALAIQWWVGANSPRRDSSAAVDQARG